MTSTPWPDQVLRGEVPRWADLGCTIDEVIERCRALEITALLHDRLTRCGSASGWPDAVCDVLAREARATAARELVRAREIASILEAFAAQGVTPLLLKGAALAYTLYDSPASRPRIDTDLLIRHDQIAIARAVFAGCSYVEPPLTDGELVFCQFQMAKTDAFGISHVFDVHWRISMQTMFADLLTFEELDREAIAIPPLGPHARTASGVHALLLACVHPVMHHRNSSRTIWIYDIDRLVRSVSKEELLRFANLAVHKKVAEICVTELEKTVKRLDTPVPAEVIRILTSPRSAEPTAVYLRPNRRWHHELMWNVRARHGWTGRLRLLREVLFPNPRYMLTAYHLGPHGAVLLPVLYVHRCAHGFFKILAGRK